LTTLKERLIKTSAKVAGKELADDQEIS